MHALYLHMYAFSSWKSCGNIDCIGATSCLADCLLVELPVVVTWKTETSLRLCHPPSPLRPLCLSLYRPPSRSPLFFVPSFYPYSLSFSYFSSFPLFSILLCIIFLFHDFVLAFRRPWPLLRISFSTRLSFRTSFSSFLTTSSPYFLFHSSSSASNQCCRWSPRLKIKLSCISCYSQALPRRGAERMRCRMLRICRSNLINIRKKFAN